jgi:hypothetical protein
MLDEHRSNPGFEECDLRFRRRLLCWLIRKAIHRSDAESSDGNQQ